MKHVKGKITKETKLLGRKERILDNIKGKTLDIGCGEGELLIKATLLGYDIIGMDRSFKELAEAKETAKLSNVNINTILGYVENMPFKKETFDTIIMGEILEHLEYPAETVKYVLEFLKPSGKLLITTPSGFAHPDADHKNFFFTDAAFHQLNKYWVFDFLPFMWLKIHKIIIIEELLNNINGKCTAEEIEYVDSKHESLDLFITITK